MEKKVLEMYVSPALEVVELEVEAAILSDSQGSNMPGTDTEKPGDEI
jgi:hypothetical protein